jgi:hypothetical protein
VKTGTVRAPLVEQGVVKKAVATTHTAAVLANWAHPDPQQELASGMMRRAIFNRGLVRAIERGDTPREVQSYNKSLAFETNLAVGSIPVSTIHPRKLICPYLGRNSAIKISLPGLLGWLNREW